MGYLRLRDVNVAGKRVLVRADLNTPIAEGKISNDARIRAFMPTLVQLLNAGAKVMVMSHIGRPPEGNDHSKYSLAPIAADLSKRLNREVPLLKDWISGVEMTGHEVVLLENVRLLPGEKANDDALAKKMAALCDVYVNDAFGTAHRAQASTYGVANYAPIACAGPLLEAEVTTLTEALANPDRPMLAIVGGAKVSTKLLVLNHLIDRVDQLVVGGGMANTFLAAAGFKVGKSLYEPDLLDEAKALLAKAKEKGALIPLPTDVVVVKACAEQTRTTIKPISVLDVEDKIVDIGPASLERLIEYCQHAKTIVWNGPMGIFEVPAFAEGTKQMARAVANSAAFSIAGGGDTLAAIEQFGVANKLSYISTGGGAFLELLEGKQLPAMDILEKRAGTNPAI